MYVRLVCFKTRDIPQKMRLQRNGTQPKAWPHGDPRKVIHIGTILILVYIHTYPVFARRINIVHLMRASRNPSACHGKRLLKLAYEKALNQLKTV